MRRQAGAITRERERESGRECTSIPLLENELEQLDSSVAFLLHKVQVRQLYANDCGLVVNVIVLVAVLLQAAEAELCHGESESERAALVRHDAMRDWLGELHGVLSARTSC